MKDIEVPADLVLTSTSDSANHLSPVVLLPLHPQVHTVLTNLLLLCMMLLAVFLSLDYGRPLVWRDEKVTIGH